MNCSFRANPALLPARLRDKSLNRLLSLQHKTLNGLFLVLNSSLLGDRQGSPAAEGGEPLFPEKWELQHPLE